MTLGQFAVAVGMSPRWALNALTRLGVKRRYHEPLARRLSLARVFVDGAGMPLVDAFDLAAGILKTTDPFATWRRESTDGALTLTVDLPRFFTSYGARLALARNQYGEKVRGRKPKRRGSAVERARAWGWDTTLLDSALRRTPSQRLELLNDNMRFVKAVRERAREP
jgi:hypothetical protein